MSIEIIQFDMRAPDDLTVLQAALDATSPDQIRRLALLMRVAGEYTDGSREKARAAVEALLDAKALSERSEFVTVIGSEGASTPCGYAIVDWEGSPAATGPRRLALGLARAPSPPDSSVGTMAFATSVAAAVDVAVKDGRMSASDIETVIINVPQPTTGDIAARARKGRAAAALGAGLALGEIDHAALTEESIVDDVSLYTPRVQTFTGPAIRNIEVIALGNLAGAGGDLIACNGVTEDLLDARSIKRVLIGAGLTIDSHGELDTSRLVATLAKSGVDPTGLVNGAPTTIFSSATPPEKHVRAALSGVLGAVLHTTRIFSTFDPVQQAPLGGGTFCCILRETN